MFSKKESAGFTLDVNEIIEHEEKKNHLGTAPYLSYKSSLIRVIMPYCSEGGFVSDISIAYDSVLVTAIAVMINEVEGALNT